MRKLGRKQLLAFCGGVIFMTSVSCFTGIGISSGASDSIPFLLPLWARHQGAIPCGKGVPAAPQGFTNRGQLETPPKKKTVGAHSQQAKATVQRRHEQIRKQLSAKKLESPELSSTGRKKSPKHGWSKVKLEFKLDQSSRSHSHSEFVWKQTITLMSPGSWSNLVV